MSTSKPKSGTKKKKRVVVVELREHESQWLDAIRKNEDVSISTALRRALSFYKAHLDMLNRDPLPRYTMTTHTAISAPKIETFETIIAKRQTPTKPNIWQRITSLFNVRCEDGSV